MLQNRSEACRVSNLGRQAFGQNFWEVNVHCPVEWIESEAIRIADVKFSPNGVSMPEAGYNALIAGSYGVPVVFVAGDDPLCQQVKKLFGEVETVAVKEGIGGAAFNLHPEVSRARIRVGVEHALRRLDQYEPYRLDPPYTLVLKLKDEVTVHKGSYFPGAKRTGDWELTFKSSEILDVMNAFSFMRR